MCLRLAVAVPAAVGPLPLDERARQLANAIVTGQPEPRPNRQRIPFLRAATAIQAIDPRHPAMGRSEQPLEHAVIRLDGARLAGRAAQLDERYEAPMGAAPLAVGMRCEPAVVALTVEKRANARSIENACGVVVRAFAEQVAARLHSNSGFRRLEQPLDRRSVE